MKNRICFKAAILSAMILGVAVPSLLPGATLDIYSTDVPMDVRPAGLGFRTSFTIPEQQNGYAVVVERCDLGSHLVPISSSGYLIFNLAFDGEWISNTYLYHKGTLQGYYPAPSHSWLDRKVDITFVTFRLGAYGNLLDPDQAWVPGHPNSDFGVGYGSTRVENMWLRVWYTLGADIQAPTGSIRIQNDPAQADRRHVLLVANVTDNSGQISQMRYRFGDGTWSDWTAYQTTLAITMPEEIITTVTAQFRDAAENVGTFSATYDPVERLSVTPSERLHTWPAQSASFTVDSSIDLWTANSYSDWLIVTTGSGSNDGTVHYAVTANMGFPRSGVITVSGSGLSESITITQHHSGFSGGDGSAVNPYQIANVIGLHSINDDLSANYVLASDLDLNGATHAMAVIAPYRTSASLPFDGSFDGNGFMISNLAVDGGTNSYLGLFGGIGAGGEVRNLRIEAAAVMGSGDYCGVLAGHSAGTIRHCLVSGSVSGSNYVGGVLGAIAPGGTVAYARSSATVAATGHAGGLVGRNEQGAVLYSLSTAPVSGVTAVGGLAGSCDTGGVYQAVSNFWDTETSQLTNSAFGSGQTTVAMQTQATFTAAGWDFVGEDANGIFDDWAMGADGYPIPRIFHADYAPRQLEGEGTSDDPFLVAQPRDLEAVARDRFAHYRLTGDLDLAGITFHNRAVIPVLNGVFDGNGHVVRGLRLLGGTSVDIGFIGRIESSGRVHNLTIEKAEISGGRASIGGLAGYNDGTVFRCVVSANIQGSADTVGGIVGKNYVGVIAESYAIGNVEGKSIVGGLAGLNQAGSIRQSRSAVSVSTTADVGGGLLGANHGGMVSRCQAIGNVTATRAVGGLIGYHQSGVINLCYASGRVTASDAVAGGLLGYNNQGQVLACYAVGRTTGISAVGGLVGAIETGGNYLDAGNFWDTEASTQTESAMGAGRPTAQMQTQDTFVAAGWDFAGDASDGMHDDWVMSSNDYPRLYVFSEQFSPRTLSGAGTEIDPYLIATPDDLMAVNEDSFAHYRLEQDVDLAGVVFRIQAVIPYFSGVFDGNGHAVRNLTISGGSYSFLGLFGRVEPSGIVRNLSVKDCAVTGGGYVAALAALTFGRIETCFAGGTVNASGDGVGGLVGIISPGGEVERSHAAVTVSGGGTYVGGLAGVNTGMIRDSYATGNVAGNSVIGGLIGYNYQAGVVCCYSVGAPTGSSNVGGLVGYATTGGGYQDSGNFWDTQASQRSTSFMGSGRTTAQMQVLDFYNIYGWDFNAVWSMPALPQGAYPELRWQRPVVVFDPGTHGEIVAGDAVQQITRGTGAVAPEIVPFDDFIFLGWNAPFDAITNDTTISAVYAPVSSNDVIVTFRLGGKGVYSDPATGLYSGDLVQCVVPYGSAILPPSVTPLPGLVFDGWDSEIGTATNDLFFGAVYCPVWTVTFDLDGKATRIGGGELRQVVRDGHPAVAPEIQENAGWSFACWDMAFDAVTHDMAVAARYHGNLEVSFNPNVGSWIVNTLALQTDGKILVGGGFTNIANVARNHLARLNPDGTLDTGFNPNAGGTVYTLAVQSDGKILTGGWFTTMGGVTRNYLARLNADGTIDTGFNPSANGFVSTLALQADGKILVGGWFTTIGGVTRNRLARLNADGTLDTGFNPNANNEVYTVAVQADGKILVGGLFTTMGGVNRNRIARLNADGTLDTGFNPNADSAVDVIALQSDGKILVGGSFTAIGGVLRRRLARLNPDGTLDTSFNPTANDSVSTLSVQADGKILVGGYFTSLGEVACNRLARLYNQEATDELAVPSAARAVWLCGGTWPVAARVTFDLSVTNGAWTPLGLAVRSGDGWELTGVSLPTNGAIRARAVISNGGSGESLLERITHFALPGYVVAFDLGGKGGRTGGGELVQVVAQCGSATAPLVEGNAGWLHTGWSVGFNEVTADLTVTALYVPTYTVTFDLDGKGVRTGGGDLVQVVSQGESAVAPAVQGNAGWAHAGWDVDFNVVTADLTVTALYVPAYTVTFDLGGKGARAGGGALVQVVPHGSNASAPVVAGIDTWIFTGWNATFQGITNDTLVTATYRMTISGDAEDVFQPDLNGLPLAITLQADGKILVGGNFTTIGGVARNRIARMNPDGTLDTSFNPAANDSVSTLVVQADGKILIGGNFSTVGGVARFYIARLNADGTLDTGFNPSANGSVSTLALQADGKILVGGWFTTIGGVTRSFIARLNVDGTLDTGFNPSASSSVSTLAVLADGKILVGGSFTTMGGVSRNRIARLNADGTPDLVFNPDANDTAYTLRVQADGKILVGGSFTTMGGVSRNRIARLNADGSLDTGFNPNADTSVTELAVHADGGILVGGNFTAIGGVARNRIARLNPDGTLDTGFDPNANGSVYALAVQADGKVLVGGSFTTVGGQPRNRIARLRNEPSGDSLAVPNACRVTWSRFGTAPEASRVNFDLSTDGGGSWAALGAGTRMAGGWELAGLTLPTNGAVRARAIVANGEGSGLMERLTDYDLPITVCFALGAHGDTVGGGSLTQRVAYGATALAPDVQAHAGWAHIGWDLALDGITEARTITALYAAGYAVTFDLDGKGVRTGGGALAQQVAAGGAAAAPEVAGVAPWRFDGWSTAFDAVTSNLTVMARYLAPHTVTFELDGKGVRTGGGELIQTVPHGGSAFSPQVRAIGNWVFTGWDTGFSRITNDTDVVATYRTAVSGDTDESCYPDVSGNVEAIAVQPDGKILIGGSFTTVGGQARNQIARLNPDGTLDAAFTPNANSAVCTLAVQADGKILIGGWFTVVNGVTRNYIARLNPDGTLDTGFNPSAGGKVETLAVQADGKILVGGSYFSTVGGQTRNRIARLNPDGTVDDGFNPNASGSVLTLAVQADGKILVGGSFTSMGGVTRNRVARLNADGTVDMEFNPDADGGVYALAVQPSGKILLGGDFVRMGGVTRNHLARLNADGSLDGGFDPDAGSRVLTLAVQADGKIFAGGWFWTMGGVTRNGLARLNPDGTLDTAFTPSDKGGSVDRIAVQADGRILAAIGNSSYTVGKLAERFARLHGDAPAYTFSVQDACHLEWTCGGAAPEVSWTAFDLSADGGASWIPLGMGTRTTNGWELTGMNLPPSGTLRSRACVPNGIGSGLIEDQTAFALPTVSVRFDLDGHGDPVGGGALTQTVAYCGSAWAPSVQAHAGWAFTGWDVAFEHVTSDVTVTALYIPVNMYTVVFDLAGKGDRTGGGELTQVLPHGSSATAPAVQAHEGWIFNGWDVMFDTILEDMIVVALYRPDIGKSMAFNPNASGSVSTLAVQADGKILAGGGFTNIAGVVRNRIARLHPDGTLDTGFNPNANGSVSTLAVQADGKILIGGEFTFMGGTARNRIARLNPDGTLDTGFDPNAGGSVYAIAIQSDGKILVGGIFTSIGGVTRYRIARLNADGTLDSAFNQSASGGMSTDGVYALALQADGKLLIGGSFTSVGGTTRNRIARLAPDGTLDTGFNPNAGSSVYALALQADGKILVGGGFTTMGGVTRNRIARLAADGTLDSGFNPNANDYVFALALQADGKVLAGGTFTTMRGTSRNRMARLNLNGLLDTSFNPNANAYVGRLAIQPDGKILVGGTFSTIGGESRNCIARLYNDEATDQLTVPGAAQIAWLCGGAFPEAVRASLDLSIDGGHTWTTLGAAGRVSNGWQRTGLNLPTNGMIRARAVVSNGGDGESIVERYEVFSFPLLNVQFDIGEHGTHTGGGALIQEIVFGAPALAPDVEPHVGWAHMGWDAAFDNVTADLTVTAQYDVGHRVMFDLDGKGDRIGGGEFLQVVPHGGAAVAPTVQEVDLWVFGGWDAAFDSVTNDLTVTAWYHPPCTVTFDLDGKGDRSGGGELTQIVAHGSGATGPIVQTHEGWVFTGWDHVFATVTTNLAVTAQYRARQYGELDEGFNPNANNAVAALASQADGKVLVGGAFTTMGGTTRNRIARLNVNGMLDTGFNPSAGGTVYTLAVQPDGKILVGGAFTTMGGTTRNRIARLNVNGTLDTGFNPNAGSSVNVIALQPDGKILVGGGFTTMGGVSRNRLARLNANGTLDTDFNPNAGSTVNVIALQPDGKILVGGSFTTMGGVTRNRLARLNADGTLDTGFDPNANGSVQSLILQADGEILVGGSFTTIGGVTRNRIARLNADGTLDTGFDPNANGYVYTIAVQADRKILVAGTFTSIGGVSRSRLARLHDTGSVDEDFTASVGSTVNSVSLQADGKVLLGGEFSSVNSLTRNRIARLYNTPASAMLAVPGAACIEWARGGSSPETVQAEFDLSTDDGVSWVKLGEGTRVSGGWRMTGLNLPSNGIVRGRAVIGDGAWGAGLVENRLAYAFPVFTVQFDPGDLGSTGFDIKADGAVGALALQTDGKIVAGGMFTTMERMARNRIARLNTDLTIDTGLSLGADSVVSALALDAEGGVLVGGGFSALGGMARNRLARLTPDSSVDTTFNPNVNNLVSALAVQQDGKVLVGGSFTTMGGTTRNRIARLSANGALDTGFNPNANNAVYALAVQPDGKIVIGGAFTTMGGTTRNRIVRVNTNGTLDTGFNPNAGSTVNVVALQPDGKVLVGGSFLSMGGIARNRLARLNTNGTLDDSFDPNASGEIRALAVQPDGKILVGGGFTNIAGVARSHLARLNADGSLDMGFNPDANDFVSALVIQSDGKILVGGNFTRMVGATRNRIARLNADGSLDMGGGTVSQTIAYGGEASAPEIAPQVGWAHVGWDADFGFITSNMIVRARYLPFQKVTFDLGDYGTYVGGGALTQSVIHGSAAVAPEITPQTGLGFAGWDQEFNSVTGDLAVTARYFTLSWGPIAESLLSHHMIPVSLTARDPQGGLFNPFASAVALTAEMRVARFETRSVGMGSEDWSYPMSTYYHDARTQSIYLSNEIGGTGVIRSVALNVTGFPGLPLGQWTIRLRHTSLDGYQPGHEAWEGEWTTVYRKDTRIHSSGWAVFTFDTPFAYNGVDNLMVDFSHDNSQYLNSGFCAATDVGCSRSLVFRSDSQHGVPTAWSEGTPSPTPIASTVVPNVRFGGDWYRVLPLSVDPDAAVGFTNGVWTGSVVIGEPGTDGRLVATAPDGSRWESELFSVIQTFRVTFDLGVHGTHTGGGACVQSVAYGEAATAPIFDIADGWTFEGWDRVFDVVTSDLIVTALYLPSADTFSRWVADHGLSGSPEELFAQICPERGLAYGLLYAFGENLAPGEPLLNIRIINGRPVIDVATQDPATLEHVALRVVGTTDLTSGIWSLPISPAANPVGKPVNRDWFELAGVSPKHAYFKLVAGLRSADAPGSFAYWLAERDLSGDHADLFGQLSPEKGVPYGLLYAFGDTLEGPLLNIRIVNGRPVVESPVQDAATLPYVDLRVLGSTNLMDWSLPVVPAADTAGKPVDRAWHEPEGARPDKAFFKLAADLK